MGEMFVMRRANGELFTEQINGKLNIAVWPNAEALARYKERNPELMIFLPTRLTRPLIDRVGSGPGKEGAAGFFLLAEDAPDADLENGRPITLEEIFPGSARNAQTVNSQV
jgi:hypothetical protein